MTAEALSDTKEPVLNSNFDQPDTVGNKEPTKANLTASEVFYFTIESRIKERKLTTQKGESFQIKAEDTLSEKRWRVVRLLALPYTFLTVGGTGYAFTRAAAVSAKTAIVGHVILGIFLAGQVLAAVQAWRQSDPYDINDYITHLRDRSFERFDKTLNLLLGKIQNALETAFAGFAYRAL